MGGITCSRLRAVWKHLVSPEQKSLVVHPLKRPPSRFDVLIMKCDVGIIHVDPESHPLCHLTPGFLVSPDTLLALLIEGSYTIGLNRLIGHQIQFLLNFDLHR